MAKIIYVEHNGNSHTVNVENGLSVMEGAVQNNIPGIDGDCGGGMSCATCHVYVKEEWFDKLEKKGAFNDVKDEFEAIAGIVELSGTWEEV